MASKFSIGIIIIIVVILSFGFFFFKKENPEANLPSSNPTTNLNIPSSSDKSKIGEKLPFPLKISDNYNISLFAKNLVKAREFAISPEGVLLVSNFTSIIALPDKNNDGISDENKEVLTDLGRTHGIAFYNGKLYVTEETKVSRYNWDEEKLTATVDKKLFDLPRGGSHFTRSIVFDKTGKMYISLGSSCNVCIEKEPFLAAVIVSDSEGTTPKLFAKGLRNSVALAVNPETNELWSADNGRDNLGDDLPPEDVNILKEGGDYGWPNCYGDRVHDTNFDKNIYIQDPCINTEGPVFKMQAHSAPLGMKFIPESFSKEDKGDLLVSFHGSWNRSEPTGYKVVKLNIVNGKVTSQEDFITGFTSFKDVLGRPVGLIFNKDGDLFIADDKAGNVYLIAPKSQ